MVIFKRKGQTGEILNFLVIAVAVTVIIVMMKSFSTDTKLSVTTTASSSHDEASFRSGVNAFMVMTESLSGKTFLELLGYVGYLENTVIDLGGRKNPIVIDVEAETVRRLDSIFGEGKWNLYIPVPTRSGVEIFVVADTSGSMCDDILDLKEELPQILRDLRDTGRETTINLYFLGAQAQCYWMDSMDSATVNSASISCTDFEGIEGFNCMDINEVKNQCSAQISNNIMYASEDWGNAIACISEVGADANGWEDFTIRIGIPLSDELTAGSECCIFGQSCATQEQSLQNGIDSAITYNVKVYPLRANPCGVVCMTSSTFTCEDLGEMRYCEPCGTVTLVDWMERMANETGGRMYNLNEGSPAEAIEDIVLNESLERGPIILGSEIPSGKRVRSFIVGVPMPNYEYLNVTLKQWN